MGKEETRQTFEEITEWKKLQEKQPELDDNIEFGDGEGRRAVRCCSLITEIAKEAQELLSLRLQKRIFLSRYGKTANLFVLFLR